MSDVSQGPGWWIASDGKWYPPDQHPSVLARAQSPVAVPGGGQWNGHPDQPGHVGPQFPDMFEKALSTNAVAESVSVKYDGDDERNGSDFFSSGGAVRDSGGLATKKRRRWGR